MTMKKQKTVHRFSAVAAVLLAVCLVFMMPVGAETVTVSDAAGLKTAIDAGNDVTLTDSFEVTEILTITKSITIDGKNGDTGKYKITASTSHPFEITGSADKQDTITVTFKNIEIETTASTDYPSCIRILDGWANLNVENCKLTVSSGEQGNPIGVLERDNKDDEHVVSIVDSAIDAGTENYGVYIRNKVDLDITNTKISGYGALYIKPDGAYSTVDISTSTLTGINTCLYNSGPEAVNVNAFGTIVLEEGYITLNINEGTTLTAKTNSDCQDEAIFQFNKETMTNGWEPTDTETGTKITINAGATLLLDGEKAHIDQSGKGYENIVIDDLLGFFTIENGVISNSPTISKYLKGNSIAVPSGENWVVEEEKPALTITIPDEGEKIDIDGPTCTNFVGTTEPLEVKVKNTGNKPLSLTVGITTTLFVIENEEDIPSVLGLNDEAIIKFNPLMQVEAGVYSGELAISTNVTELNKVIPLTFTAVPPKAVTPPSFEGITETDGKIEVNSETHEAESVVLDELGSSVGLASKENPSVVLFFVGAALDDESGGIILNEENPVVLATYLPISSEVTDSETPATFTAVIVMNDHSVALPTLSGEFTEAVAGIIEETQSNYKPLSMLTADEEEEIDTHLKEIDGEVIITFTISAELCNQYNGEFVVFHVKDGEVVDTIKVTPVENTDDSTLRDIVFSGSSFSSYVLAADTTPTNPGNSGSATDTGSGNYQYYPRSVPTDGIVDFGTSKVVTGMELPAGSDGTVTLNIKPTFTMPENGFYAFEIDAPGYNLDAKINGGLSFQIPVADLEAAGWTAEDIVLFHGTVGEDGKITWEALPTNLVKNENGVAYYKAAINSCSPFYIGFVKDGSVVNTEVVDPTTPETPETPVAPDEPEVLPPVDEPETPEQPTESPAPILAVLAGLGAAVVLRRK